jgi:ABC-type multidrug transport system ATPase subunit
LLILDEATNAIDIAGERAILKELATMAGQTTILLIAHRGESLALCDAIITFPPGRVTTPQDQNMNRAPKVRAVPWGQRTPADEGGEGPPPERSACRETWPSSRVTPARQS